MRLVFPIFFLLSVICLLTSGVTVANATATVTIAWDKNAEPDVIGYRVHYGTSSENYQYHVDVGNNTSCTISALDEGTTYYFAATAYDTQNNESYFSEELAHTIPIPPPPPPTDTDGDGILDNDEINLYGTDPDNADTEGDGMPDGWEISHGLDPKVDDAAEDPDNDGFTNIQEYLSITNPDDSNSIPQLPTADAGLDQTVNAGDTISDDLADIAVSNVIVSSGKDYEVVQTGLQIGARVYIDRTYTFVNFPDSLAAATYIKTANNDKRSLGDNFLSFDVNRDVTVYVAHDIRITGTPSWLLNFTDTGNELATSDTTFRIFSREFTAGTITLGGNEGGNKSSMYIVIVGIP